MNWHTLRYFSITPKYSPITKYQYYNEKSTLHVRFPIVIIKRVCMSFTHLKFEPRTYSR